MHLDPLLLPHSLWSGAHCVGLDIREGKGLARL